MCSGHSLAIKFLYGLHSSYTTGVCTCIYVHDVIIICSVHSEESICTAKVDIRMNTVNGNNQSVT